LGVRRYEIHVAVRSNLDTDHQEFDSRHNRHVAAMIDGLIASSARDEFARCSAKHAAALECVHNAVVEHAIAADPVAGSDLAFVVAAVPAAAAGPDPAVAEYAVPAGDPDHASVVAGSAAVSPDSAADHAAVQNCLDCSHVALAVLRLSIAKSVRSFFIQYTFFLPVRRISSIRPQAHKVFPTLE